jgi:hypothetical protein
MVDRVTLLTVFGTPLVVALPHGVKMTALGLEPDDSSFRLWLGLALLVVGTVGIVCVHRAAGFLSADAGKTPAHPRGRGDARAAGALSALIVVLLQLVTLLKFALLLDGHVRLRACAWVYLAYAAGALLVLVCRRTSTSWGSLYLRWGWAPLIAFGVPLALPALKTAGLVPFSPLSW